MTKKSLQTIFEELGIQNLPEETRVALLDRMTESLLKRMAVAFREKLSDESQRELERMTQGEIDSGKVEEFLQTRIPDYETIQDNVISDFKADMRETATLLEETIG